MLERLGCHAEAVAAYVSAIDLTHDPADREYRLRRREQLA